MRHVLRAVLGAFAFVVMAPELSARECPVEQAPTKFEFSKAKTSESAFPVNQGIIPKGFVALKSGVPVVHGIDISKWQDKVDFVEIARCGGKFAIIRLSASDVPDYELEYRTFWGNARALGLLVGGYHNFVIRTVNGPASRLTDAQIAALIELNLEYAKRQARLYAKRLKEVLSLDPVTDSNRNYLGEPYLPIVIDASYRPQASGTPQDRARIGAVYRAGLCAWTSEIRSDPAFTGQRLILFTTPYVFKDYAFSQAGCLADNVHVWIQYRTFDGDAHTAESDPEAKAAIAALCTSDRTDRCIMQQYTSFGGFALFQKGAGLDMNRFYGTEEQLREMLQRARKQ